MYIYCKSVRKSINIQGKTIKATNSHKNQPIDTASKCHHSLHEAYKINKHFKHIKQQLNKHSVQQKENKSNVMSLKQLRKVELS